MKDYDAYLFDWDGTVAQSLRVWLDLVRELIEPYSVQATDKEIVRKVFGRARVGLSELGVPEADLPAFFKKLDSEAVIRMPAAPLYPGMKELLEVLAGQGKKLAVITATVRPVIQKVIRHHGLEGFFQAIVTGDEVTNHKPDPEGLLFALEHLAVARNRAVMTGDSEKDVRAAHNAGIDSILFYPPAHEPFHDLAELQADNPTYTIHSWRELLSRVQ